MITGHQHGGDIASFQQEYPDREVHDFSANINPLGMPLGVRQALMDSLEASLHYPDPSCRGLRTALSEYEGVPQDWIFCGNGASELISRIAWGLHPRRALLPAPTFAEYERSLEVTGCDVQRVILREAADFALDESFPQTIQDVDVVFLCNPNNPTGTLISPDMLSAVQQACRAASAFLIIDECFLDFSEQSEQYSMKHYLQDMDNLVILRAFTKIFAMPGLRLGYLLSSNRRLLDILEKVGPLWNVSVPAQLCGIAAARETQYLVETKRQIALWRDQLAQGLSQLGCKVYPSAANYLLFRAQAGLANDLRPMGILLRDCSNFAGLEEGYYRTAVRTPEENQMLLNGIRTVFSTGKVAL